MTSSSSLGGSMISVPPSLMASFTEMIRAPEPLTSPVRSMRATTSLPDGWLKKSSFPTTVPGRSVSVNCSPTSELTSSSILPRTASMIFSKRCNAFISVPSIDGRCHCLDTVSTYQHKTFITWLLFFSALRQSGRRTGHADRASRFEIFQFNPELSGRGGEFDDHPGGAFQATDVQGFTNHRCGNGQFYGSTRPAAR